MGGDGTASEVASGLLTAFASSASGRADLCVRLSALCDRWRSAPNPGTPTEMKDAAQAIAREVDPIDAGRIDYTSHDGKPRAAASINVASCGNLRPCRSSSTEEAKRSVVRSDVLCGFAARNAAALLKTLLVRIRLDDQPAFEERILHARGGQQSPASAVA